MISKRFGGEIYDRTVRLQAELQPSEPSEMTVHVVLKSQSSFDVTVMTSNGKWTYDSVAASLLNDGKTLSSVLNGAQRKTVIVSQFPPSTASSSSTAERLHVFYGGHKHSILLPAPKWLQMKGEAASGAAAAGKGYIRAPMPSLVVDVKVKPEDRVVKGQAIIILESMKTETVLRAESTGVVKGVGCKKGEMVDEGRELIEVQYDSQE